MKENDSFSMCHPLLNFFYFAVALLFTMFNQHPVFLGISYAGAFVYGGLLNGWRKTLKQGLLLTLPGLLIIALLNPMFNHYGVTMLYYIESSGNWITLEALVYGLVLGAVMFIVIQWFSCYNTVMTSDKFIYLFGRIIPALSLVLSMALRFVPRFLRQLKVIRNGQKAMGRDVSEGTVLNRIKYGLQMVSILVTWALENAIETSDSMRSRGYGLHGRTAFSIYRLTRRDCFLGAVMGGLFAVFTVGCAGGAAYAVYDPRIVMAGFSFQGYTAPVKVSPQFAIITYICFGIFCFIPVFLELYENWKLSRSRKQIGTEIGMAYRQIYEELDEVDFVYNNQEYKELEQEGKSL